MLIETNETLGRRGSFYRMIDDIIIAIVGMGLLAAFVWLFVIEPRTSVHSDH